MTLLRMDNVLLVVDDLEAAITFFGALGLELEGRSMVCYVRGPEGIMVALAQALG